MRIEASRTCKKVKKRTHILTFKGEKVKTCKGIIPSKNKSRMRNNLRKVPKNQNEHLNCQSNNLCLEELKNTKKGEDAPKKEKTTTH